MGSSRLLTCLVLCHVLISQQGPVVTVSPVEPPVEGEQIGSYETFDFVRNTIDSEVYHGNVETESYDGVFPVPNMLSLRDGSQESCIVAPPSGQLKMRVSTGEVPILTAGITMEIIYPCTSTDSRFQMFTPTEPVNTVKMCSADPVNVFQDLYTWRFTCTCSPGNCDVVEIRAYDLPSGSCARLCEIDIVSYDIDDVYMTLARLSP